MQSPLYNRVIFVFSLVGLLIAGALWELALAPTGHSVRSISRMYRCRQQHLLATARRNRTADRDVRYAGLSGDTRSEHAARGHNRRPRLQRVIAFCAG